MKITFSAGVTFEGTTEWTVFVDGDPRHLLSRGPQRRLSTVHGWVADDSKPSLWTIDHEGISIPKEATLKVAKAIVTAALKR